jgi:hypothetical protein
MFCLFSLFLGLTNSRRRAVDTHINLTIERRGIPKEVPLGFRSPVNTDFELKSLLIIFQKDDRNV